MANLQLKTTRNTNLELLRIIAMLGVVILHIINPAMGGGLNYATNFDSKLAMNFLEGLFICAVNIYVLISGYFLSTSNKRNIVKIIELLFLVVVLNCGHYLFTAKPITFGGFMHSLIPNNWFVLLYISLYLISPFLNIIIEKLNKNQYLILLTMSICLFSIYPTIIDVIESATASSQLGTSTISMYGSQSGYTIVNFVLIYMIGGFLRKFGLEQYKTKQILPLLLVSFTAIVGWMFLDFNTAGEYCNPLVIMEAILIFVLFAKLNLKTIKPILWLSKASFMVYLIHIYMLHLIPINSFANKNFFIVIAVTIAFAALIYLIGFIINLIYSFTIKLFFNKLSKKEKLKLDYFK